MPPSAQTRNKDAADDVIGRFVCITIELQALCKTRTALTEAHDKPVLTCRRLWSGNDPPDEDALYAVGAAF